MALIKNSEGGGGGGKRGEAGREETTNGSKRSLGRFFTRSPRKTGRRRKSGRMGGVAKESFGVNWVARKKVATTVGEQEAETAKIAQGRSEE